MRICNRLLFIDKVRIYARGGRGGQGSCVLSSSGGEGGDVQICAVEGTNLSHIARLQSRRFIAGVGGRGERSNVCGKKGREVTISVPPGTTVYDQSQDVVCDLSASGMKTIIARGGRGGDHSTPSWHGLPGQCGVFTLQLKSLADVGLVGFPNAGKSTLLRALSKATPKIGNYPFTTLRPEIGSIHRSGCNDLSIADLPGLVEGAHRNVGRGHKFLQHVERTQVLLYIVDINGFQLSSRHDFLDPYSTIRVLVKELELYSPGLARNKEAILVVNKIDHPHILTQFKMLLEQLKGECPLDFSSIVACSAATRMGTQTIKQSLFNLF